MSDGNENHSQPFDAPVKKRRRFRLTDARGCRRELAGLYAQLRNEEITERHAATCTAILKALLEALRLDDLETRLSALEGRQ